MGGAKLGLHVDGISIYFQNQELIVQCLSPSPPNWAWTGDPDRTGDCTGTKAFLHYHVIPPVCYRMCTILAQGPGLFPAPAVPIPDESSGLRDCHWQRLKKPRWRRPYTDFSRGGTDGVPLTFLLKRGKFHFPIAPLNTTFWELLFE